MVRRTSLQVSSTSASAFSTCYSQAVGHLRAFSHTNANWTSDDDNDRSSIPDCIIVHKEQQRETGEYYWIENIKRHPPHLKLYANLLQIPTFNLITVLSFTAVLRVQHNHKKIAIIYYELTCVPPVQWQVCVYINSCIQSVWWININIIKYFSINFPTFHWFC